MISFLSGLNKGMNPFVPSLEQVQAAGNQSDFYMYVWGKDQASLQAHYLQLLNCSDDDSACRSDAFNRSINEATGSGSCSLNAGGTAWFWFTGERKWSHGLNSILVLIPTNCCMFPYESSFLLR